MRFVRFEFGGEPQEGVLRDDEIVALPDLPEGVQSLEDIMPGGPETLAKVAEALPDAPATCKLEETRLLAPIARPGKFLAIGMNYEAHMREAVALGAKRPERQFWFNKQTSCVSGPYDQIAPGITEKLDYEVELGVVIGKPAKHVSAGNALDHVFGYLVVNDVSARDWQRHSPTFTMGKSFDTHGPIGPWIVTADEIPDPQALDLECRVDDEVRQSSNTRDMIYPIAEQIAYLSTAFTLEPGDILATGTPEGVGIGRTPPLFLQEGQTVTCRVAGIGEIRNRVGPRAAS